MFNHAKQNMIFIYMSGIGVRTGGVGYARAPLAQMKF